MHARADRKKRIASAEARWAEAMMAQSARG
jgi:hypothetical protein